jgi:hypothetical protein
VIAGEWKHRVFPRSDNQLHLCRLVLNQIRKDFNNRPGIDDVKIVQNKDEVVPNDGELIEQGISIPSIDGL